MAAPGPPQSAGAGAGARVVGNETRFFCATGAGNCPRSRPGWSIRQSACVVYLAELTGEHHMPLFFFHLENDMPFKDVDDVELPDVSEVRREAAGFARDVMRLKLRQN